MISVWQMKKLRLREKNGSTTVQTQEKLATKSVLFPIAPHCLRSLSEGSVWGASAQAHNSTPLTACLYYLSGCLGRFYLKREFGKREVWKINLLRQNKG